MTRSTHGLEAPLSDNCGRLIVSAAYIEFCIQRANAKLAENFSRIDKFEEQLCSLLADRRPEVATFVKRVRQEPGEDKVKVVTEQDVCDIFEDFSLNQEL